MDLIFKKPCFVHVGIDAGEAHRARMSGPEKGMEQRYILIEEQIDRDGCKNIIQKKGLRLPEKSGCFICPFQKKHQWKQLRRQHPELFCKAQKMEKRYVERRKKEGKEPLFMIGDAPIEILIDEKQLCLPGLEEIEYPPCECGL